MPVGCHARWHMTNCLKRLLEKSFGGIHIPFLAQYGVNEIAISIDGEREGTPLPVDFDVGFVDVPRCSCKRQGDSEPSADGKVSHLLAI
ncbi:hypothetical protein KSC_025730 [Ktedonobacter sp. SOSP1-52]|nr:hypothetical protein KSC_025730 [Ktedonobacter sp. SOSP1-52]